MMPDRRLFFASSIAALVLAASAALASGEPPGHLVPFPEDKADAKAPAEPVKPMPPKSDFTPRFRAPAIKQVQHLEPVAGKPAADSETEAAPAEQPQPAETPDSTLPAPEALPTVDVGPQLLSGMPGKQDLQGREALNEAFTKSKTAETDADYTAIIALCERGKQGGVSQAYQDYAGQLMGWAYNRRGELRAKAGESQQALADFEAAVRLSGAWRAIHNRGVSYAAAGRTEDALADFDRTIELNPRYPNAYFNRGELRYRDGDYMSAVDDYTQALRLGPPDAATFNSRGHAFYRLQRFGDALRDYGEAIQLDPANPDPLINRGDAYSDLGQYGEAAEDYRAAVKVDPKNGRAFQAAAWLMATCPDGHYRDDKLAIDAAKRAIDLGGETFRNLTTLAAAQASAGNFNGARTTQEKAIAAAPQEQVVAGEKMMSLYQRETAFRDRPVTAYERPEDIDDKQVRQAAVQEMLGRGNEQPNRQAEYRQPVPGEQPAATQQPRQPRRLPWQAQPSPPLQQQPPQQQPPARARLFGPRGRI